MEPPHNHHLSAAIGWLELGNPSEGLSELEKLDPAWQDRADVLEVRWRLRAAQDEWAKALEAARRLAQADPERASGWLFQAYALRRVPDGGIQAAWEVLEPAEDRFPEEPTIPYNLACYACQLGELNHARRCLERAMKKASPDEIRQMALRDPDLEPLWKEIRNRNL